MFYLPTLICTVDQSHDDDIAIEETISKTLSSYQSLLNEFTQKDVEVGSIVRLCKAQLALMSSWLTNMTSNRGCREAAVEVSILDNFTLTIVLQTIQVTDTTCTTK